MGYRRATEKPEYMLSYVALNQKREERYSQTGYKRLTEKPAVINGYLKILR